MPHSAASADLLSLSVSPRLVYLQVALLPWGRVLRRSIGSHPAGLNTQLHMHSEPLLDLPCYLRASNAGIASFCICRLTPMRLWSANPLLPLSLLTNPT